MVVQLLTGVIGTFGFTLLFNERRSLYPAACVGGLISWGVYLLMENLGAGIFASVFLATVISAFYSELLARKFKLPSTVLFLPSVIPLIPGSSLYYMMDAAVKNNETMLKYRGSSLLTWALAIALGASLVKAYYTAIGRIKNKYRQNDTNRKNNR